MHCGMAAPTEEGQTSMITEAIKRWLEKLFAWFSGKSVAENAYASTASPLTKSVAQESIGRSTSDSVTPQPGAAPRIVGQGEISCSTSDEWPERATPPTLPHTPEQKLEFLPYHVRHGIVNEGFTEGHVPDTYNKY